MNEKMRTFFELDGKKRGVRLDAHAWETIDLLATRAGCKWSTLARQWAQNAPKDAEDNLTAVIRAGAMAGMLALQRAGNIATATATTTQALDIISIDWTCGPASGYFLLDTKAAANLSKSLESALTIALADVLEASMPSEEDRQDREDERREEVQRERRAEEMAEERREEEAAERRKQERAEEDQADDERAEEEEQAGK
jgi:predicted DNA-binding ribbon-helix-helix protein